MLPLVVMYKIKWYQKTLKQTILHSQTYDFYQGCILEHKALNVN